VIGICFWGGRPQSLNDVPVARQKISDRLPRFYESLAGKAYQETERVPKENRIEP